MIKVIQSLFLMVFVCGAISAQYYTEDLETQPSDWILEGAWTYGNAAANASQYFNPAANTTMMLCANDDALGNTGDASGRLTTGDIDLSGSGEFLLFTHDALFINGDYMGADEMAIVSVSEDEGMTWTEVQNLGATIWGNNAADISAYSNKTIRLAFDYVDGGGWNYGYCIDNLAIIDFPERAGRSVTGRAECFQGEVGIEMDIYGGFENEGREVVNTLGISYTLDGTVHEEMLEDLEVGYGESAYYTFGQPVTIAEGFNNVTDIKVTSINGSPIEDANGFEQLVRGLETYPGAGYFVEEATGTWCTWCPRGATYLDAYAHCFPNNFVGVAVHNGQNDPMVNAAYDNWLTSFPGFQGFPSVISERTNIIDPSEIGAPAGTQMTTMPDALLMNGAEFDEATRKLTIAVRAEFLTDMPGAQLNAIIVENNVTGTGTGWDQVNAYSGGGQGVMGGYELLPSPVPGELMVYNHVGRMLPSGPGGIALDSDAGEAGTFQGYNFPEVTIPADYDLDNIKIIGIVMNAAGQVVNAVETTIEEAVTNAGLLTDTEDILEAGFAAVYPNPTSGITNITMTLETASPVTINMVDALGRTVTNENYGLQSGTITLVHDVAALNSGLYVMNIKVADQITTQKVYVK